MVRWAWFSLDDDNRKFYSVTRIFGINSKVLKNNFVVQ